MCDSKRHGVIAARPLVLQSDCRLGGIERLVFALPGELMQIPAEVRKCVAFIGAKRGRGHVSFAGTVFFVGCPIPGTDQVALYAVTARHVIEKIGQMSVDGHAYMRLNTKEGGSE